jgi:uncharacterized protein YdaL
VDALIEPRVTVERKPEVGMNSLARRWRALLGVFAISLIVSLVVVDRQAVAQTTPRALILYDYQPNLEYGKLGQIYAIMLRNLLGHFIGSVEMKPIEQYNGEVVGDSSVVAIFYIGAYYGNTVPAAFINDVKVASKTVVWFKHNIWNLAWDGTADFNNRYGIAFDGLVGMNSQPTAANPNPGFYDTVLYKGRQFPKYYRYDAGIFADPDVGVTRVAAPATPTEFTTEAQVVVPVKNSATGVEIPYVIRSGNFWYIADIPFTYIGPRDRYLVFSDVLHDIMGSQMVAPPRGLVRLEDVSALTTSTSMRQITDRLRSRRIPFSIALIPHYRDPDGVFNNGVPMEIPLSQATDLKTGLNYALRRGGRILMHGYTHQINKSEHQGLTPSGGTTGFANPYKGVSGEDFEFWDIVNMIPVDGGDPQWTRDRMVAGLAALQGNGYPPFAWEVPHYHASPTAYRVFPEFFATTFQRAVYYTSENPDLNPSNPTRDIWAGQFYPYIINHDHYGQRILPENLGNIEYDISDIDPTSDVVYTYQDLLTNADYALVVRDGFGSFFFHPFWVEPSLGTPGLADLTTLVDGMTAMGYIWTDASRL